MAVRRAAGGPAAASRVTPNERHRVRVYKDGTPVGTLTCDAQGRVAFAYDEAALDRPEAAVSVRLSPRAAPYDDHVALPCFENLLPEGDIRRVIAVASHHAPSDVVRLLGVFGGECAGALSLWPEDREPPAEPIYRPCTRSDLGAAFGVAADVGRLATVLRDARLSMSGAQDKLVLYRRPPVGAFADGEEPEYRLPVAGAPSTVLVKRDRGHFGGLLHNELAGMRLMRVASVPTAAHVVSALAPDVYETARFDRVMAQDGRVRRLHAEDGCQITGRVSGAKYAETGGPTYAELVTALIRHSADPRTDGELLFRWAVANLAIGNRDAHAKNVSLLYLDAETIRLAPAYDVVCTVVYPDLDTKLPFRFGGQPSVAALTPHALKVAAREFKLTLARAAQLTEDVVVAIERQLDDVLEQTVREAGSHPVLDRVAVAVRAETAAVRCALLGG